jgi:serine phosphatase RsbU (regulator of sigma subunit)
MSIKKVYITLILLLVSFTYLFCQDERIVDSLNKVLRKTNDKNKAEIYNQLAREYKFYKPDKAIEYANKALSLAKQYKNIEQEALALYNKAESFREKQEYNQSKNEFLEALTLINKLKTKDLHIDIMSSLGSLYDDLEEKDSALYYLKNAYKKSKEIGYKKGTNKSANNLGIVFFSQGKFDTAKLYLNESYKICEEDKDTLHMATNLNILGICTYYAGKLSEAVRYYLQALKFYEALKDRVAAAKVLFNIGNIYRELNDLSMALNYYNQTLNIGKEIKDSTYISSAYNNIGILYKIKTELQIDSLHKSNTYSENEKVQREKKLSEGYKKAILYLDSALMIRKNKQDEALAETFSNVGNTLHLLKRYDESIAEFEKALKIAKKVNSLRLQCEIYQGIGANYSEKKNYSEAFKYYSQSLNIAKAIDQGEVIKESYKGLYIIYEKLNDYKNAFNFFKLYVDKKDSISGEEINKFIKDLNEKYQTEQREAKIKEQELLKQKQEQQIRTQKILLIGTVVFAIMLIGFIVFVVAQLRLIQKKNALLAERNAQIQAQKEEIQAQRDLVMKQKEEITDSIHYAQRIQKAVMPSDVFAARVLRDYFILFRPRDIVSGDFYWITYKNNKVIAVAADCTGHGVPGAFMSMLGVSFLNEIVNKLAEPEAHIILNELRNHVKTTLDQTGKADEAKDGMDIALAIIDFEKLIVQFAGAYNPLYICRPGETEIIEIKADKMPIGIYIKEKESFTPNLVEIKKGDVLYIFSDGYVSQFGGNDGRKFMTKNFKDLLMKIFEKPMDEQRNILDKAIDDWRGNLPQVDDILVMGIRI